MPSLGARLRMKLRRTGTESAQALA